MSGPIERSDFDYLAKSMGFESMQEVRQKRLEELAAAERARLEAEAEALAEERRRVELAEDAEIKDALKSRIKVTIDGEVLPAVKTAKDLVCPGCDQPLPFAKETILTAIRRASLRGEQWMPEWRSSPGMMMHGDTIPAGSNQLTMRTPLLLFAGNARCPSCSSILELAIEIDCMHDGEKVSGIRRD